MYFLCSFPFPPCSMRRLRLPHAPMSTMFTSLRPLSEGRRGGRFPENTSSQCSRTLPRPSPSERGGLGLCCHRTSWNQSHGQCRWKPIRCWRARSQRVAWRHLCERPSVARIRQSYGTRRRRKDIWIGLRRLRFSCRSWTSRRTGKVTRSAGDGECWQCIAPTSGGRSMALPYRCSLQLMGRLRKRREDRCKANIKAGRGLACGPQSLHIPQRHNH